MNFTQAISMFFSLLLFVSLAHTNIPVADPFETINRQIYQFNLAFDATMLKPPAKAYRALLPSPIRDRINSVYDNLQMLPAIANDLLQVEFKYVIKDTWRFLINSSFGLGGLFDMAALNFSLPPHHNDLGLTFAKWGIKNSPYIVIPLLGPSTIRDGLGMLIDYSLFTPFPYIANDTILYSVLGLRYIDLRAQLFDIEPLMDDALDKYTFLRDAYLQHRNALIENKLQSLKDTAESSFATEDAAYVDDIITQ